MKKLSHLLMIGWLSLIPVLGFATPANAQVDIGTVDLGTVGSNAGFSNPSLPSVIGLFIQIFLGLLGIIFLILVIYAGFLWMTAGGNTDNVAKAKRLLAQATVGLILIVAAYAISQFVVSAISTAGL